MSAVSKNKLGTLRKLKLHYTDPSVPESLVKYLRKHWLPVVFMWSKILRRDRSIYEEGDTNMLIEAYVDEFYLLIR